MQLQRFFTTPQVEIIESLSYIIMIITSVYTRWIKIVVLKGHCRLLRLVIGYKTWRKNDKNTCFSTLEANHFDPPSWYFRLLYSQPYCVQIATSRFSECAGSANVACHDSSRCKLRASLVLHPDEVA